MPLVIRLADYVFKYLADYGVKHAFAITGGGSMHLNDALGRETRIKYICNHHEQASTMAAEAYARVSGKLGVVSVTTGPGGLNTLNGLFGAWTDSLPVLVISGQVKRETCMGFYDLPGLRQLGDQETDIITIVKSITKYAVLLKKPEDIRYELEKAIHLATTGRKGPCWIDIPIDLQSAQIDENNLRAYKPKEDKPNLRLLEKQSHKLMDKIKKAKRPVVLLGSGLRLAGARGELEVLKSYLKVPMVVSWTGADLIPSKDPLFAGRAGSLGDRPGNFTVQNADLLIVLGCRLSVRQVSYNWKNFARNAEIVHVDVDKAELNKPTVKPHMKIQSDLKIFLQVFNALAKKNNFAINAQDWLKWCKERVEKYPVLQERQTKSEIINPYYFVDQIFKLFEPGEVIACGDGTACVVTAQAGETKAGQHLFTNSGCASMGYDLPAAIGSAFAKPGQRIICFSGDGSIQMNIQELQTIIHHQLPIKIFVFNNQGYLSIKLTQKSFFKGQYMGSSLDSGLSFPDIIKIAEAYGFKTFRLDKPGFEGSLQEILDCPGPVLCEVIVDPDQGFEPKLSSRILPDGKMQASTLEDMSPFLSPEELQQNMIVD